MKLATYSSENIRHFFDFSGLTAQTLSLTSSLIMIHQNMTEIRCSDDYKKVLLKHDISKQEPLINKDTNDHNPDLSPSQNHFYKCVLAVFSQLFR